MIAVLVFWSANQFSPPILWLPSTAMMGGEWRLREGRR